MSFSHGQEVAKLLQQIEQQAISVIAKYLELTATQGGCVYTAGNGGSAANASHLAAHLNERGIPAICLSDNVIRFSALANDVHYEQALAKQLEELKVGGQDAVVVFSCSGASPNILRLLEFAQRQGIHTRIGLLGFNGGMALELCLLHIALDSQDYGAIEDCHSAIIHALRKALLE